MRKKNRRKREKRVRVGSSTVFSSWSFITKVSNSLQLVITRNRGLRFLFKVIWLPVEPKTQLLGHETRLRKLPLGWEGFFYGFLFALWKKILHRDNISSNIFHKTILQSYDPLAESRYHFYIPQIYSLPMWESFVTKRSPEKKRFSLNYSFSHSTNMIWMSAVCQELFQSSR